MKCVLKDTCFGFDFFFNPLKYKENSLFVIGDKKFSVFQ